MQTADFDTNDFENRGQSEADKKLLVKFSIKPKNNHDASAKAGRPIFEDVEYIHIMVPGQRDGAVRPASPRDKARFPEHYRMFKERREAPVTGTPLAEWPVIQQSMVEMLAFKNIKTVEQLSDLNDSSMVGLPGIQTLKQKAKDWLESAKDSGVLTQMREDLSERDATITDLTAKLEATMARLDALESKPTKKGK